MGNVGFLHICVKATRCVELNVLRIPACYPRLKDYCHEIISPKTRVSINAHNALGFEEFSFICLVKSLI